MIISNNYIFKLPFSYFLMRRTLVEYFKKNLRKGYTTDSLKWALVRQGYSRTEIMMSLEQANKELAEEAPVIKERPVINYELLNEQNQSVIVEKRSWWKKILGL